MHEARRAVRRARRRRGRAETGPWRATSIVISASVSDVQDLIAVYRELAGALRLCAASRPHRSGHGLEGHRRLDRGAGGPAPGRHRRHDPHLAHARAGRRPHARGDRRAGDPADHGAARPSRRMVIACPGCGRTTSTVFQELAQDIQTYRARRRCRSGARLSGRREACSSRSWAASSTVRANRSMPTSGSRCPAPASSRRSGLHRRQEGGDAARRPTSPASSRRSSRAI